MSKTFTFTFEGKNAEEMAERFMTYFWDGGLDQSIEQDFLDNYNLSLDDVSGANYNPVINTDNAEM